MSATETSAQSISAGPIPEEALAKPSNFGPVSETAGRAAVPTEKVSAEQRRFREMGLKISMVAGQLAMDHLGIKPEGVGRAVDAAHDLVSNEDVYEGLGAVGRFSGNLALTAVGLVPVVGEGMSLAAEAALKADGHDLTPDVPGGHKLIGYAAHAATGGLIPQLGAVEQTVKDWDEFWDGVAAVGRIVSEHRKPKKENYMLAA